MGDHEWSPIKNCIAESNGKGFEITLKANFGCNVHNETMPSGAK